MADGKRDFEAETDRIMEWLDWGNPETFVDPHDRAITKAMARGFIELDGWSAVDAAAFLEKTEEVAGPDLDEDAALIAMERIKRKYRKEGT